MGLSNHAERTGLDTLEIDLGNTEHIERMYKSTVVTKIDVIEVKLDVIEVFAVVFANMKQACYSISANNDNYCNSNSRLTQHAIVVVVFTT
jgi:hypothetical protein